MFIFNTNAHKLYHEFLLYIVILQRREVRGDVVVKEGGSYLSILRNLPFLSNFSSRRLDSSTSYLLPSRSIWVIVSPGKWVLTYVVIASGTMVAGTAPPRHSTFSQLLIFSNFISEPSLRYTSYSIPSLSPSYSLASKKCETLRNHLHLH